MNKEMQVTVVCPKCESEREMIVNVSFELGKAPVRVFRCCNKYWEVKALMILEINPSLPKSV